MTYLAQPTKTNAADITKRIQVIDVLRGFALLGIIILHSFDAFLISKYSELTDAITPVENVVKFGVYTFISKKFYAIFSFLFGLSFAMQLKSAKAKGVPFVGRFVWRLFILLGIGSLHALIFPGDILQVYAPLGLLLILVRNWPDKKLLWMGGGLFLLSVAVVVCQEQLRSKLELILWQAFQIQAVPEKLYFQFFTGRLFITASLFLFGLYAGNNNLFQTTLDNKRSVRQLIIGSGIFILLLTAVNFFLDRYLVFNTAIIDDLKFSARAFRHIFMSCFYVAVLVQLYRKKLFRSVLQWLVPVGQMGLSVYIMQSVFLLFYYQLNSTDIHNNRILIEEALSITFLFFVGQVLFANWWMSRYRFGPLEWLWRSLTYLKWQPMINKKSADKKKSFA